MRSETTALHRARIVGLCTAAAVIYGVVHDQFTVRLCPEYFTVAHPPLFPVRTGTELALCWGIAATLPIGLLTGAVLAIVAQPPGSALYPLTRLGRKVVVLLGVMGCAAFGTGWVGRMLAETGRVVVPGVLAALIPAERHAGFVAAWGAHLASYAVGLAGAAWLIYGVWVERGRPQSLSLFPKGRKEAVRAGLILLVAALIFWWRLRAS